MLAVKKNISRTSFVLNTIIRGVKMLVKFDSFTKDDLCLFLNETMAKIIKILNKETANSNHLI